MVNCRKCAKHIRGGKTGLCQPCASADPELRAKRIAASKQAWALHPEYAEKHRLASTAHNQSNQAWKDAIGRATIERTIGDIPVELRADYRILCKKVGAKEARKAIAEHVAKRGLHHDAA